jgi:hypothetical protein
MNGVGLVNELVPDFIGRQYIKLTLARPLDLRRAFHAIDINVALETAAQEAGLVLPLEMTVTSPSQSGFRRHVYQRVVPSQLSFTPQEGGQHLIRLREVAHNAWWGAIVVVVAGETNE